MAKTSSINVRINPETKAQAEALFSHLGLDLSSAINIFIHQSLNYGGIPFELKYTPNAETREAIDDVRNKRNLSKSYTSVKDLMADLTEGIDDDE